MLEEIKKKKSQFVAKCKEQKAFSGSPERRSITFHKTAPKCSISDSLKYFISYTIENNNNTHTASKSKHSYHPSINVKPGTGIVDNLNTMENLIEDLELNAMHKIKRAIEKKISIKKELEENIQLLTEKLKHAVNNFENLRMKHTNIIQENTQIEYLNARIQEQLTSLRTTIPNLQNKNSEIRETICQLEKDTRQLNYEAYIEETEITALKDETRRMEKKCENANNEKKKLVSGIILFKKKNDFLKENLQREMLKSDQLISDVSNLIDKARYTID